MTEVVPVLLLENRSGPEPKFCTQTFNRLTLDLSATSIIGFALRPKNITFDTHHEREDFEREVEAFGARIEWLDDPIEEEEVSYFD